MNAEQVNREIAEFMDDGFGVLDNRPGGGYITDFDPMHRIEHAWMVVEKLKKDFMVNISCGPSLIRRKL